MLYDYNKIIEETINIYLHPEFILNKLILLITRLFYISF